MIHFVQSRAAGVFLFVLQTVSLGLPGSFFLTLVLYRDRRHLREFILLKLRHPDWLDLSIELKACQVSLEMPYVLFAFV